MKLLSMTDFVVKTSKFNNNNKCSNNIYRDVFDLNINYAEFLKQPLTLGMFVPCDEKGNILKGKPLSPAPDSEWIRWENEEFGFYKARDKVLFKNIQVQDEEDWISFYDGIRVYNYYPDVEIKKWFSEVFDKNGNPKLKKTIEDLIRYKIELSENVIEQFQL